MNAQDIFYIVAAAALVIMSGFIIFFFVVLYRIKRMSQTVEKSLKEFSIGWRNASLVSAALKIIKTIFRSIYA